MEEILKTKIRALEEENERLKAENKRLKNAGGLKSDANLFEVCTVGSTSSLQSKAPVKVIKGPFTLRFKAYGFGLERLEWISKARVNQKWIDFTQKNSFE